MVSEMRKEVWREAMDDAGDRADRNLERKRRRYLRGMGFGMDGHEKGSFDFVKVGEVDA